MITASLERSNADWMKVEMQDQEERLVYKCDLCDAGYVDFTHRHLHQRVAEHKNSS